MSEQATPLDKVLQAVSGNPDLAEDYYTLFLNSELYVPLWKDAEPGSDKRREDGDVAPLILTRNDYSFIAAFDTPERLAAWAEQDMECTVLHGYEVLALAHPENLLVVLNPDTPGAKIFAVEEIQWLMENVESSGE